MSDKYDETRTGGGAPGSLADSGRVDYSETLDALLLDLLSPIQLFYPS